MARGRTTGGAIHPGTEGEVSGEVKGGVGRVHRVVDAVQLIAAVDLGGHQVAGGHRAERVAIGVVGGRVADFLRPAATVAVGRDRGVLRQVPHAPEVAVPYAARVFFAGAHPGVAVVHVQDGIDSR